MQSLKSQVEWIIENEGVSDTVKIWQAIMPRFYKQYCHCNNKEKKYSARIEDAEKYPGTHNIQNALKSIRRK